MRLEVFFFNAGRNTWYTSSSVYLVVFVGFSRRKIAGRFYKAIRPDSSVSCFRWVFFSGHVVIFSACLRDSKKYSSWDGCDFVVVGVGGGALPEIPLAEVLDAPNEHEVRVVPCVMQCSAAFRRRRDFDTSD